MRGQHGFAMLGALLIAALAALFAALALTAALASTDVAAADGSRTRALAAARSGLDQALHLLQWRLIPSSGSREVVAPSEDGSGPSVPVDIEQRSGAEYGHPEVGDLVVRLLASTSVGRAQASAGSVVALCPEALPVGLSVAEDLDAQADVLVEGSGVYAGGSVRGRESISFTASAGAPLVLDDSGTPRPPDLVHGSRWPIAAVHAGGAIVPAPQAEDSDVNIDPADVASLVAPPNAPWLAAASAHALDPGAALDGDILHLDRLPPSFPTGEPAAAEAAGYAAPSEGYLIVVDASGIDGGLVVTGQRDPLSVPVTVVVIGDAVLGVASSDTAFRGALVVTGALEVAGPAALTGHLACRRLLVRAPLTLTVPLDWREHPPLGSAEPRLLARE